MRKIPVLLVLFLTISLPIFSSAQQVRSASGCTLPAPEFTLKRPNIFSAQQEQWLGEAQARENEPYYILLPEKDSEELTRIGQKLLAQLPPTPVHYHFRIYESEEADAFSGPGGYVYVSRKLITDAHNEDEIAGILAHEIGHIYTHQVATVYTRWFKERMGVTSLGDQTDVDDKLQQLLNVSRKYNEDLSDDQLDQDEFLADRVGMYAMTRAGYQPQAFAQVLDRISANKGHMGNFLFDRLGISTLVSRRVRAARKLVTELPASCQDQMPGSSPQFTAFQQQVRSAPVNWLVDPTPGLKSFQLVPPMRPVLDQVRFSPNGKYLLAQNETSIDVLSRSPLKRLFTIDAPRAEEAHFTPDSTEVVCHYPSMRVERWNVADGKRESYFELVDYKGCRQTSLSPDGKTLVCLSTSDRGIWLKLMDVDTGKLYYDNKNFYEAMIGLHPWSVIVRYIFAPDQGTVAYSKDGRYLVVASGSRAIAFDLVTRKQVSMLGSLSDIVQGPMAFVGSDKLVFSCDSDAKNFSVTDTFKKCFATFPSGYPIHDFRLGYQWIDSVAHGDHVLIGPMNDSASALVDPSTGKMSALFKLDALDLYDQTLASETASGGVTVGELGSCKMQSVDLPVSPLPELAAAAFSPDGRFLAFSNRSRSAIWDLDAQKQVALMRPFQAVRFDGQDRMFAQYQNSHTKPGENALIDLKTGKVTTEAKYDPNQVQRGNVLAQIRPMVKSDYFTENVDLEVYDPATGAQLWKRRFPHETPQLVSTDGNTLLLMTDLNSETGGDEMGHAGHALLKTSDKRGGWIPAGMLVEEFDSRTGTLEKALEVPQYGYVSEDSDSRTAQLYGDYLVVYGNNNNSTIYRVSDGQRLGAFFGTAIAGDGSLGLIAATDQAQEITIYDANTGRELKRVTLDQIPRAARFIPARNALLVFTASQRVYTIFLPAKTAVESAQAK